MEPRILFARRIGWCFSTGVSRASVFWYVTPRITENRSRPFTHSHPTGNSNGFSSSATAASGLSRLAFPSAISRSFSARILCSSTLPGSSPGSCGTSLPCTASVKISSRSFVIPPGALASRLKFCRSGDGCVARYFALGSRAARTAFIRCHLRAPARENATSSIRYMACSKSPRMPHSSRCPDGLRQYFLERVAEPLRLTLQSGVVDQQLFRVVADDICGVRIFLVQVVAGRLDLLDADLPGALVFHTACKSVLLSSPPSLLGIELFNADRLGLVVVLHARRVRVLVVPDMLRGLALGEEQQIRLDAGVGAEHAVGQAHD